MSEPVGITPGEVLAFLQANPLLGSESPFQADSPASGLCIMDSECRYLWVNIRLADLNGRPAIDHLGKTARELFGKFADHIEPYLQCALSTGESILNVETSGEHPAKKMVVHWVQHFFPLKDECDRVTKVGIVINELSETTRLQKTVRDLDGRLRREMDRLQVVLDVSNLLSTKWDVPLVFPMVSARIRRVLRQEFASFLLYNPATQDLVRHAIDFPLGKGFLATPLTSGKNTPAELALQKGTSMIFSKKDMEGFEVAISSKLLAEGLQSVCCVPMIRPKGPLGVLVLASTRENAFHAEELGMLDQVASQLALAVENHNSASEIKELRQRLGEERKFMEDAVPRDDQFGEFVGSSVALREVLDQVATVATSGATVLILGETGTGKELVARAIHRLSRRKDGPFVKVNCAAIPTGLLESELFGHERGAFTGAINQKIGRMQMADRGTLFLDEIGEILPELQPKLLRVLQDLEFERLGSNRTIKVDFRLIAATNRDLAECVARHEFRSDLYYRLSVFPILMPPLRERREDIPPLIRYFVRLFSQRMDHVIESIPQQTMDALVQWNWPGNIRELENLMERSVILSEGSVLRVPLEEFSAPPAVQPGSPDETLNGAEREHILRVLRDTHGALSGGNGAARRLGLKRTTLQSKMQRLKITRQDYVDPPQS